MNNHELADLYVDLAMKYEEDNYVECGFKEATEARQRLVDSIKSGAISKKDFHAMEPVFAYSNVKLADYIKPKKRFLFF